MAFMVGVYYICGEYYIYGQFLLDLWLVLHLWFILHLWVILLPAFKQPGQDVELSFLSFVKFFPASVYQLLHLYPSVSLL